MAKSNSLDDSYDLPSNDEYDVPAWKEQFLQQVERDINWALGYYAARNREFERLGSWYFKEHYGPGVEAPAGEVMDVASDDAEDEHLTIVNIPTNTVNMIHGIFTDEEPDIACISTSGRKSADRASNAERFLYGTYWINRQTSGEDPWDMSILDDAIYAWGCIYSYWDVERAKHKGEMMDFYSFPIVVKRINPGDIYPLLNGVREKYRGILWIVDRTVREVEEEWGVELDPKTCYDDTGEIATDNEHNPLYEELSDETLIQYVDYWVWRRDNGKYDLDTGEEAEGWADDWTLWHCVTANGQCVKDPTPMPEYEFLPYEIFFYRHSPSAAGERMGLSALYTLIEPVQEMEYLANRQARMLDQYSDPVLVVIDPSNEEGETIEKGPGTVITVGPGGDAHWLSWQGAPPDLARALQFWKEQAQDSFPPVLTGLQGGTSGLDTIALQQGGKMQTNKPRKNIELAMQRVNTKIFRLLQNFSMDEPVFVMGQRNEGDAETPFAFSIKGKDTKGYENTIVRIRGRFPQEELRNIAVAAQAVGAGLMSSREAGGKYLYIQDPKKSFLMWLEEQIIKNPEWQKNYMAAYMQLPMQSPISQALSAQPPSPQDQMPDVNASDLAAGNVGAAVAQSPGDVQHFVQKTPVESNMFSAMSGGGPWPSNPGDYAGR